jgi:hypothetical protein
MWDVSLTYMCEYIHGDHVISTNLAAALTSAEARNTAYDAAVAFGRLGERLVVQERYRRNQQRQQVALCEVIGLSAASAGG